VPRLSIIIAHQCDQRLEDTLLSILENRPADSEIIVAHDGSYGDPYDLADEVLFVETQAGTSTTSRLNEALYAACAPVVHILAEGCQIEEGWCEGPISKIQYQHLAAVAPVIQTQGSHPRKIAGLDQRLLSHRGFQFAKKQVPATCAGPLLAAGFYSRRVLLSLGGLLESVDSQVADVDLALCLHDLEADCQVDASSVVHAEMTHLVARSDTRIARDLGSLMAAHHQHTSGLLAGLKGATHHLLRHLVNPSQWAPALAWGLGIAQNRLETSVADRLIAASRAHHGQTTSSQTPELGIFNSDSPRKSSDSVRRAA